MLINTFFIQMRRVNEQMPVTVFSHSAVPVMKLDWSPWIAGQFFLLDAKSRMQMWDLTVSESEPQTNEQFAAAL